MIRKMKLHLAKSNVVAYHVFDDQDFGEMLAAYNFYVSEHEKYVNEKVEFALGVAKAIGSQVANSLSKMFK
ncbi:hypothetical protein NVP1031O_169 [Vibrio phage 1.031.O._10N.261.46.F8]|nr:hypothetical protein NVP1031O_169 [Vibrio phage 1.031.O._10N.261.46.F8]